jgi:uncharacterized protein (TIGR02453 family)
MPKFTGFPKDTLRFLAELERNNNREWFEANKDRYETMVRGPALDFITAMGPELEKISGHFVAIPKKVGGSLMRVYRDTRFSKDKTPYKTNVGIQFRHELGKDVHAPGYYVHIDNTGCFLGVGVWHPEPAMLNGIRERILEKPQEWRKLRTERAFTGTFELGGDSLKRPPRGVPADHALLEDLKRKDFIATTNLAAADIESPAFARQVGATFRKGSGLMAFLCAAAEVSF